MAAYYQRQSSGRYTVNGDVTDWVQVPYNAANYGSNYCGGIVCDRTWQFVNDSIDAWYNAQIDAGKTPAEIDAYLAQFDVWDRYDIDGDGNFNEPDGYIDHFQSVHAGEGEETGGGAQGTDAIWSHRWYASVQGGGPGGLPGINIGSGGASGGQTLPNNPTGVYRRAFTQSLSSFHDECSLYGMPYDSVPILLPLFNARLLKSPACSVRNSFSTDKESVCTTTARGARATEQPQLQSCTHAKHIQQHSTQETS